LRAFFAQAPWIRLQNQYGPSETHVVTAYTLTGEPDTWPERPPFGRPLPNVTILVLDESLRPVPPGCDGELWVAGPCLAHGYYGKADGTAERFRPNPLAEVPADWIYRTGDRGRLRFDGELEFLGRLDDQLKIRGYRVEPGEVESALSSLPGIRHAVVAGHPDPSGATRLVAYVEPADHDSFDPPAILAELSRRLPPFALPSTIVPMRQWPKTASGKVDRRALPAPSPVRSDQPRLPATPSEHLVAELWREIFPTRAVDVRDDFFACGGNSLLAVRLVAKLAERAGRQLPLPVLFAEPTIAGIAASLDRDGEPIPATVSAPAIAWADECRLDPAIVPAKPLGPVTSPVREVLLTGATGFLGTFLLDELLRQTESRIWCLVRAPDEPAAWNRLRPRLEWIGRDAEQLRPRLVPLPGDLTRSCLGMPAADFEALARRIDAVYHAGADVNYLYPYPALRPANVGGTREILRLACSGGGVPLHLISTIGVLPPRDAAAIEWRADRLPVDPGPVPQDGYSQSKWVAERLAEEAWRRGLPVRIYRPGRLTAHSRTGLGNPRDLLTLLVQLCDAVGAIPEVDLWLDLTPVDYASQAIVRLAQAEGPWDQVYHVANPTPVAWSQVAQWARQEGYPWQTVPLADWRSRARRLLDHQPAGYLSALRAWLTDSTPEEVLRRTAVGALQTRAAGCRHVAEGLAGTAVECPRPDRALVGMYLRAALIPGRPPGTLGSTR